MASEAERLAHNEYMRRWRARQSSEWWASNRQYMKNRRESYSDQERVNLKAYKRDYYQRHKDHYSQIARERLDAILADPIKAAEFRRQRRVAKRAKIRGITLIEWEYLLALYDLRCAYCLTEFSEKNPATADHVLPVRLGGPKSIYNIVPACQACNLRKGGQSIVKFLQREWAGVE